MAYFFLISNGDDKDISKKDLGLDVLTTGLSSKLPFEVVRITVTAQGYAGYEQVKHSISTKDIKELKRSIALFFDVVDLNALDVLEPPKSFMELFGLLSLSYPEIRWLTLNEDNKELECFSQWLSSLVKDYPGYNLDALFDSFGTRVFIKNRLNETFQGEEEKLIIRIREKQALVVDDEADYVYLNGLAAYKSGYYCKTVNSYRQLDELEKESRKNGEYDLMLLDKFLSFHDKKGPPLSSAEDMAKYEVFQRLKPGGRRFLITVGLDEDVADTYFSGKIWKPTGGIYELIAGVEGENTYIKNHKVLLDANRPNSGKSKDVVPTKKTAYGHSVPGLLFKVSETLLERSERLLKESEEMSDAICASVLAIEAKELLCGRRPTHLLKACALQHQAEIQAESIFFGVKYDLDVRFRLADIKLETENLSLWFNEAERASQSLNARLNIVEILAKTFADHNQFEEEQEMLQEARVLRHEVNSMAEKKNLGIILRPFRWYITKCMNSMSFFGASLLIWIVLFGFTYAFTALLNEDFVIQYYVSKGSNYFNFMADTMVISGRYFFTLDLNSDWKKFFEHKGLLGNLILMLQGLVSLANLSLFISHLYMIVSRR